jgi:hypothetical protein
MGKQEVWCGDFADHGHEEARPYGTTKNVSQKERGKGGTQKRKRI